MPLRINPKGYYVFPFTAGGGITQNWHDVASSWKTPTVLGAFLINTLLALAIFWLAYLALTNSDLYGLIPLFVGLFLVNNFIKLGLIFYRRQRSIDELSGNTIVTKARR